MNYFIKLDLLKLNNAFTYDVQGKKEKKQCICIPIDDNELVVDQRGSVYLDLFMNEKPSVKYEQTHYIKRAARLGVDHMEASNSRILGNAKPTAGTNRRVASEVVEEKIQEQRAYQNAKDERAWKPSKGMPVNTHFDDNIGGMEF